MVFPAGEFAADRCSVLPLLILSKLMFVTYPAVVRGVILVAAALVVYVFARTDRFFGFRLP